jgi:hypothetical protein
MRPAVVLLPLLLAAVAAAVADERDVAAQVASYLAARDAGRLGAVTVEAYVEPRRPTAPPEPLEGVSVLLLPYSPELETELDALKATYRDSLKHYAEAADRIEAAAKAWERALIYAGGGELVRGEVTDPAGRLRFAEVPVGEWFLFAWLSESHDVRTAKIRAREAQRFQEIGIVKGFEAVRYWKMRLRVEGDRAMEISLHDRNLWLTGIRPTVRVQDPLPPVSQKPLPKRR